MDLEKSQRRVLVINGKPYKEESLLGKGGFAKVYKSVNMETLQEVAIKKIFREKINNKSMIRKVNEEIMNHRSLKHESILAIYDFHEDSRYIFLVLELCSKGDLEGYLTRHSRKRITEAEACTIAKRILDGLLYLHSSGILHRDLKLANILVTENNSVKIADFGLSTKLKGVADTHRTMCGTPNFMSPEVAAQAPQGLGVDMWGLGVVLYTLICGERPFKSNCISSVLEKVCRDSLKIPDFVSPEANDILCQLLEKNPHFRISAARARDHPFFHKYPETTLRCNTNDSGLGVSCLACADCSRTHLKDNTMSSRYTSSSASYYKSMDNVNSRLINLRTEESLKSQHCSREKNYVVVQNNSGFSSQCRPENISQHIISNDLNKKASALSQGVLSSHNKDDRSDITANVTKNLLNHDRYQLGRNSTFVETLPNKNISKNETLFHNLSPISQVDSSSGIYTGYPSGGSSVKSDGEIGSGQSSVLSTKRLGRVKLRAQKGFCHIKGKEVVLECEMPHKSAIKRFYVVSDDNYMVSYTAQEYIWPPPQNSIRHHFSELPFKWKKKYALLMEVVYKVKSKTVKITIHSDVSTCQLMESSPDHFSVDFYTGEKVRKKKDNIIFDRPGRPSCTFTVSSFQTQCTERHIVETFTALFEKCLRLEKELDDELFPITCGKRLNLRVP